MRRDGPFPGLIGALAARAYEGAIARRNRRFDAGQGVIRFDRAVISVGNLSVGGTGKTPMVRWIVSGLLAAGYRPCIAMRGYRGGGGESDEAAEHATALAGVPIVAQPNRAEGLIRLFGREYDADGPHSDCIVLDDGFQHRRIARDLDLVLIDATRDPFADRLLPAGWLREPVESLRRAQAVVLTHAEAAAPSALTSIEREVSRVSPGVLTAVARHHWTPMLDSSAGEPVAIGSIQGRRVVVACAIGNPGPFLARARQALGGPPAAEVVLRDHDPYSPGTVRRITEAARGAHAILITAKDWSKLSSRGPWPCPVLRPRLAMNFDRGGEELMELVLETAKAGAPED
ncbi:MAG: tetraacyldisaccharide 4'-kinase [Phycisphaerales bacterium]